jgi:hypothetical protein
MLKSIGVFVDKLWISGAKITQKLVKAVQKSLTIHSDFSAGQSYTQVLHAYYTALIRKFILLFMPVEIALCTSSTTTITTTKLNKNNIVL